MSKNTKNYGLFEYEPEKDGAQTFNIQSALNENWEKVDEALAASDPTKADTKATPTDADGVMIADSADGGKAKRLLWSNVKAALGKLFVPLARKINGKALAKDVTLTGDDIAMGADDAESLRAAMAKRDVEYGVIKPENLQEWASEQTAGGTFMLTPSTTKGVPEVRYWRGVLSCAFPWNDRSLLIFTSGEMYRTDTAGGQWSAPWRKVADCVAPETHDFPLASGVRNSQYSTSQYSKTQESVVTLNVWAVALLNVGTLIGTLPEGYRPRTNHACSIFVVTTKSGTYNSAEIVVQTDGNVYCYGSALDGSEFELGFSISFIAV